jgi:HEPN domain-containing protein
MSIGEAPQWLAHAEADLRYARLGRKEPGILLSLVAFHAQQAVEKALKAVLVASNVDFPRTHDLEQLQAILRECGLSWPVRLDKVKELTPMAVQTRYPGFEDPVEESEVDDAIRLAEETIVWAKREVGLK